MDQRTEPRSIAVKNWNFILFNALKSLPAQNKARDECEMVRIELNSIWMLRIVIA